MNRNITSLKDAERWDKKGIFMGVFLSKKCETKMQELEQLASSPLLSEDLIKLIENFSEKLDVCWISMIKGLNTCKKQLNLKAEIKLEFSDYEIRCMHGEVINSTEKIQLNEQAEKIITYVSNYLKVNKLML